VESAPTGELLEHPRHPYTTALLGTTPRGSHRDGLLATIPGAVPAPGHWPAGCRFKPRCPLSIVECDSPVPMAVNGHPVRCVHWGGL
jgi:oligopeptide/dipeptide ABC transporter ATP-binding protein